MSFETTKEQRSEVIKKVFAASRKFIVYPAVSSYSNEDEKLDRIQVIASDGLSPQQIINLSYRESFKFVLQNSVQPMEQKLKFVKRLEENPHFYYEENSTILDKADSRHQILFDSQTERKAIINLCFSRLGLDPLNARSTKLYNCIEEMLMNAQIDAHKLSGETEYKKSILMVEKNDTLVAISITDPYGSLDYSKFLHRVDTCLNIGLSNTIEFRAQRGAGIGSAIIFDSCESLFLGCQPGIKTRVAVTVPFKMSEKKLDSVQKSIFIF